MKTDELREIRDSIPSNFSDEEKDEIVYLLIDLANIYLNIEREI